MDAEITAPLSGEEVRRERRRRLSRFSLQEKRITMDFRQRQDLDNYITGHGGEDFFREEPEDEELFCEGCGAPLKPEDGQSVNAPGLPAGEIIACGSCADRIRKGELNANF